MLIRRRWRIDFLCLLVVSDAAAVHANDEAIRSPKVARAASARARSVGSGDVDCQWDAWVDWSVCQFTCGGGESVRTRKIKTMASGNGAACDSNDRETRTCDKNPCPVDCVWDDWGSWGTCSVTCGVGTKMKTRKKKVYAQYGGKACSGQDMVNADCEEHLCAIDCKWTDWQDWGGCSKSCGTGERTRYRLIAQTKNVLGKKCEGENSQSGKCGMNTCPADCVMEDWGAWEPCDVTCGAGSTRRSRKVVMHPTYGGRSCEELSEKKTCHTGVCPVHCELSDWAEWSECSATCSTEASVGTKKRIRQITQEKSPLGDMCPGDTEQAISCSQHHCPVDCKLSDWTFWSECTTTCGPGISERTRELASPAEYGGKDCEDEVHQKRYCAKDICPIDCQWTDWQDWRACSSSCGNGTSYRMRLVKTPMMHGGRECEGGYQQNRDCNDAFCPIHCQWGDWNDWGQCSTTCGEGAEKRRRDFKVRAQHGGMLCNGTFDDTRACENPGCPVNCLWSDWAEWGSCSSSCGSGKISRSRSKSATAENGGAECTGSDIESAACLELLPCPVDCEWDDWSEWASCSVTCGSGVLRRSRNRKKYEKDGGHTCFGSEDDEQVCTADPCPVDCVLGSWGRWSDCSASCARGQQTRARAIAVHASLGGVACNVSDLVQTTNCEDVPCPVHCAWATWGEWSKCTKECEGGTTYRHRNESVQSEYGGKQCEGSADEEMVCNAHGCPVDCKFEEWSEWGECSKSCNTGKRTATRELISAPQWGGQACDGGIVKSESCNEQPCPEDCTWGDWSHYSICSKTCGGGEMLRTRPRIAEMYGGLPCSGNDTDSSPCSTQACPQDCRWGQWTPWSACSKDCGGGSITRTREVLMASANGGDSCFGSSHQEAGCNFDVCSTHCEWNDWDAWGPCSASCNGGTRWKSRSVKAEASNGGLPCAGNSTESETCSTTPCPVDCTFELWQEWGDCSTSCGVGSRFRTRVKKEELYGGAPCQDVMWEVSECSNPDSSNCPEPSTTTTTSLKLLTLPEGELAWSALHNVWEPQASRGQIAVPYPNELSKTFTESKDPSYTGKPYKPCKQGELNKTLEAFEAMKKPALNSTEAAAVKVIDEIITNMTGSNGLSRDIKNVSEQVKDTNLTELLREAARTPDTVSSKNFTEAFAGSEGKMKDGRDVVAEVAGDLGLDVMEAEEFVQTPNVAAAAEKAIAKLAGARSSDVKVDITVPEAMLSEVQRTMKGNVNVAYMIEVYKQDGTGGNASMLASRISALDINAVTSEVREQVTGASLSFTLRAVSLSVTVLPVTTDGSIDLVGASGLDANSSLQDATPRAMMDGKAQATAALVETVEKHVDGRDQDSQVTDGDVKPSPKSSAFQLPALPALVFVVSVVSVVWSL